MSKLYKSLQRVLDQGKQLKHSRSNAKSKKFVFVLLGETLSKLDKRFMIRTRKPKFFSKYTGYSNFHSSPGLTDKSLGYIGGSLGRINSLKKLHLSLSW